MDRRLPLYKLDILRAVVELGGVKAAADQLRVTQPVVTAHVRSLEKSLGVRLFAHVGRRLELTDPGRMVYEWAQDSDIRASQLERRLDSLAEGRRAAVLIAAGMSVGSYRLPAILTAIAGDHPDLKLSLDVVGPDGVIDSVVSGRSDFGVLIADEIARDHRVRYEQVGHEELIIVGAPGLIGTTALTVEALAEMTFVSTPVAHMRRTVEERHLHHLGIVDRKVIIELGHPEAMKTALVQRLGVALMFRCAASEELRSGALVEYPLDGVAMSEPVHFVTRQHDTATEFEKRIYDEVAAGFGRPRPSR